MTFFNSILYRITDIFLGEARRTEAVRIIQGQIRKIVEEEGISDIFKSDIERFVQQKVHYLSGRQVQQVLCGEYLPNYLPELREQYRCEISDRKAQQEYARDPKSYLSREAVQTTINIQNAYGVAARDIQRIHVSQQQGVRG